MQALVTTDWLAGELGKPDVVVFDATKYLPNEPKDGSAEFRAAHIPGARYFDIDEVADVRWRALPVASKPAPYSPNRESPMPGDNVALVIEDRCTGRSAVYAPGLAAIDERLWGFMRAASCVLVDGTFWSDDEMVRVGVSGKRARDIGHLPQSGPGGMLEQLDRLPAGVRKILIHINNTNPILDELSVEFGELERRGVEVAEDGMEISL